MKAVAEETGKVGFESEKTEETLGEKIENVGIRNPVVVEKAATKKKVRVVKKIVKKKIMKKVPKRVSVASNCNDLEKVACPNPNDNAPAEVKKPNPVIDDLKEVENVKEFEVRDMEKGVHLVETNDSYRNESQIGGLVTSFLLGDQIQNELQDSDQNRIELQDSDRNQIEFQDSDLNQIKMQDSDQNQIELQGSDQNHIELQHSDQNRSEVQDSDQNLIKFQESDQNRIELQDSDQNRIELQDGDQNQIELQDREHDINTMNVEEHDGEEGVKELVVNNETNVLKSLEALKEEKVPGGEIVASRCHRKQRTKIFIHGLVEETKEEDIRRVFEEIGEVVEVKLITNCRSGKGRGFGFIRYASADLANWALTKYHNVEICGRPCHTAAIEGNDTILLNYIDKKWKRENVVELLQKIGIKKIDEVLVVSNPDNTELNRGFAYLEFETKRDAQMAYHKLQNKNIFGKHSSIKVSWADPLVDPVEEEMHKVKSVYAEHVPFSWDEKEVKDHFKIFGEIESIALAKNLRSTMRNDFAFINYKTYEAARTCIEALTKKSTDTNGPRGHLKVSLAKSIPKVKPIKTFSDSGVNEVSKFNQKSNQSRPYESQYQKAYQSRQPQQHLSFLGVHKLPQKPKNMIIGRHEGSREDLGSSTTAELVQLLREQASWKQGGPSSTAGVIAVHQLPAGGKQPFAELGSKSLYHHDPRAYHQSHLQNPNVTHPRPVANMTSFPRYDQQRAHYTSGSFNVVKPDPRYFQIRDQTTYPGNSTVYRRMH